MCVCVCREKDKSSVFEVAGVFRVSCVSFIRCFLHGAHEAHTVSAVCVSVGYCPVGSGEESHGVIRQVLKQDVSNPTLHVPEESEAACVCARSRFC